MLTVSFQISSLSSDLSCRTHVLIMVMVDKLKLWQHKGRKEKKKTSWNVASFLVVTCPNVGAPDYMFHGDTFIEFLL